MDSAWKLWRSAGDSGGMVELKFSENTSLIKEAFLMFVEATTEPDFNVGIKEEATSFWPSPLLISRTAQNVASFPISPIRE